MGRRLGQHFLSDERLLDFEAEAAGVEGKSVLEIGAGDGRLTSKLLSRGARRVFAVEIDSRLAKRLRKVLGSKAEVYEGDFLGLSDSLRFDVVVGNIPYYITSPILLKLARMDFDRAVLCIQKEVAERMVAQRGTRKYGRLSVFCQLSFKAKILAFAPKEAFSPPPKVDSCIISISKTGFSLDAQSERIIGAIFSHKKKSLKNAIIDARAALFGDKGKREAAEIAQTIKYSNRRVFTLSPQEALEAAEQLKWHLNSLS
ncbi:MAG: 16S rRNA (adenine(1518)-N(6)/adenine(1519)-N(6))-dimethyltransferase RsmA [Candidatus Micrarchaeota archaeon]|nr:16S rRNA (adenine(1518)-N(6)/adenine(1519)-N(6))-dimethyltransferase RsmA [Candidatus Micrarchaeota archaeon]